MSTLWDMWHYVTQHLWQQWEQSAWLTSLPINQSGQIAGSIMRARRWSTVLLMASSRRRHCAAQQASQRLGEPEKDSPDTAHRFHSVRGEIHSSQLVTVLVCVVGAVCMDLTVLMCWAPAPPSPARFLAVGARPHPGAASFMLVVLSGMSLWLWRFSVMGSWRRAGQ